MLLQLLVSIAVYISSGERRQWRHDLWMLQHRQRPLLQFISSSSSSSNSSKTQVLVDSGSLSDRCYLICSIFLFPLRVSIPSRSLFLSLLILYLSVVCLFLSLPLSVSLSLQGLMIHLYMSCCLSVVRHLYVSVSLLLLFSRDVSVRKETERDRETERTPVEQKE